MQINLAKIGFLTSVLSYALFAYAEFVHPGFVSHVFSVHLFLIPIIGFGGWWAWSHDQARAGSRRDLVIALPLGLLLALTIWSVGEVFGDLHFLLTLVALVLPLVIWLFLRQDE